MKQTSPIILGSRSSRRFELLSKLIVPERIQIVPPLESDEQGFDDVHTRERFTARIQDIVLAKQKDVLSQLRTNQPQLSNFLILTCDTTIVATDVDNRLIAIGQPPDQNWQAVVRRWFEQHYAGQTHAVMSCVCIAAIHDGDIQQEVSICETRVRMRPELDALDWYLATGESLGKAGGYAIQGLASVFIDQVEGSFSNVVGLPLENTKHMLESLEAI
jgi:septum formation protein